MPQGHVLHYVYSGLVVARSWKLPMTEELIQKLWYIYTMEYYSAIKNEAIMNLGGKWMELGNSILSEVTKIQK